MASDFYVKLDGIDGESQDEGHKGWIEVKTFSMGALQNIISGRATDVTGRGQFKPFIFSHIVDKASPKIMQYCMSGQKITKVNFHVCRAVGGSQVVVFEVILDLVKIIDTTVKSVRQQSQADDVFDSYITVEEVSLVANKVTWKATTVKDDNTIEGSIEASFDQVANK